MSRLAKNPIIIPEDIKISMTDNEINFEGKLGKSSTVLPIGIKVDPVSYTHLRAHET